PLAVDVPRHDEALGRLPDNDLPDIRLGAVFRELVPSAAETGFHDSRFPRRLADTVIEGPPASQSRREDVKGVRLACINVDTLAHGRDRDCRCHLALSFSFLTLSSTSA